MLFFAHLISILSIIFHVWSQWNCRGRRRAPAIVLGQKRIYMNISVYFVRSADGKFGFRFEKPRKVGENREGTKMALGTGRKLIPRRT